MLLCSLLATTVLVPSFALAAQSWPIPTSVVISSALQSTLPPTGRAFEPSDIATLSSGVVLVSDEGDVAVMNDDGTGLSEWLVASGADLEGVAVDGNALYIAHERDRDVYTYDLVTHIRLATYDLSPWIAGNDNLGIEGLAIHGSTMYVGLQSNGSVYEFDISSGSPVFITSWATGLSTLSALSFAEDGKLYVMGAGVLRAFAADRSYAEYLLPSQPQPEGVALRVNCATNTASLFIANDTGPVYRYDNFPVSCPVVAEPTPVPVPVPPPAPVDADADGVAVDYDCNDSDPAVSSLQTFYRDADGDSLGSSVDSIAVCSVSAPSGYVTNTNDLDDTRAYFLAAGASYGAITVTYGNGTVVTYPVFSMPNTRKLTTVSVYKNSQYLVVIAAGGKRVAAVNAYTGQVLAWRVMPAKTSVLDAWLISIIGF